ncbi:hypothetical protein F2P81_019880 [Scophthalmus maximus]|uniref:Uncharacterized protein n=1 Tax=Scophthalmus maximus TaxID=52904 RepID=A0A6A4S3Q5_SCOMX|nr:hypothetical protein F2P81_019880 [Scophthalmus maximus]
MRKKRPQRVSFLSLSLSVREWIHPMLSIMQSIYQGSLVEDGEQQESTVLIIRVLVSRATSSVSIQDPDQNIRWSVKLLTATDVQVGCLQQPTASTVAAVHPLCAVASTECTDAQPYCCENKCVLVITRLQQRLSLHVLPPRMREENIVKYPSKRHSGVLHNTLGGNGRREDRKHMASPSAVGPQCRKKKCQTGDTHNDTKKITNRVRASAD